MTVEDDHGQRLSSSPKKNENVDEQKHNKKNQFLFDESIRPRRKVNRLFCTDIAQ